MTPASPVCADSDDRWGVSEVTFAKDQPEYIPLPAIKFQDGLVVTRWSLSLADRIKILLGGSVYLGMLTYNRPLQPIRISTSVEDVVGLTPDVK